MSSDPLISNPAPPTPPDPEQIRKKRRLMRRNILLVSLALAIITALEVYFLQMRSPFATISNSIAVLSLFNLMLVFLFLLIVLITRNLVKLYNERKSKIIGSKFRTKIIIAFLILALVPSILLFFVGSKLFTYSIGKWFTFQVENSLELSMKVARNYYKDIESRGFSNANKFEKLINNEKLYLEKNRSKLNDLLVKQVSDHDLGGVIIFDRNGGRVTSFMPESTPVAYMSYDYSHLIKKSVKGENVSDFIAFSNKTFLVSVVPLAQEIDNQVTVWGYVAALTTVHGGTLSKIETIRTNYEKYRQQHLLRGPLIGNYYITYIMITMMILFSAIWLGIYMARGITVPIQQLADGTRRITEGDLDFKINVDAKDEIGILVDSFNKMTEDLKQGKRKIDTAHENLKQINMESERGRYYNQTILENIGAGVISIAKTGKVTTFNRAAQNMLDMDVDAVIGTRYKNSFHPFLHKTVRNLVKKMNESHSEFLEEQVEINFNDINLTVQTYVKIMRDADKSYLGLLIVFEDLTALIKAQRVAAWREVAQGIAHEIKNPLTPIQLNTQRLRKKYYESKEAFALVFDESIEIINQEVEDMKEMLGEFLRFARMPLPNPKPAALHKIIDDVAILYKDAEKDFSIRKVFDPGLDLVFIDSEQMRRVFINLFDNALDVIQEGGFIKITTLLDTRTNRIKIEFSDNGTGIRPENREKLFLPHFTTKKRGTGLGLAIVNRIILDHNGTIHVRNNKPKGTMFIIEIPYVQQISSNTESSDSEDIREFSSPF
jgi:two-component system nitrogen regulation sensor histidine kinase NtrY